MFVVAAEFMGASEGLGYLLIDGQQLGKPAQILAAIVIFAILGKTTDWLIGGSRPAPLLRWQDAFGRQKRSGLMLALDRVGKNLSERRPCAGALFRRHPARRNRRHYRPAPAVWQVDPVARHCWPRPRHLRQPLTLDATAITAPHAKIGIIFQEPRLLPWLSVADNIGFGLSELPAARTPRKGRAARHWKRVGLTDKANALAARIVRRGRRSGSRLRGRWCRSRKCCCWMNRSPALDAFTRPRSTGPFARPSGTTRGPTLMLVTHDVDEGRGGWLIACL